MVSLKIKLFHGKSGFLLILLVIFLLRLAVALPGLLTNPAERFSRPDTPNYLESASAMLTGDTTHFSPKRAPGFPLFATTVFRIFGSDAYGTLAVMLVLVSTATLIPIWMTGKEAGNPVTGIIATVLLGLNLTMIAHAPMLLSDTLATFFIAWQLYFFVRFQKRRNNWCFLAMIAVAALGSLIRPINSAWIWPALFLLTIAPKLTWQRKVILGICSLFLFVAILFPRMASNASRGAGFCIDTNTGAMSHQNGAMLLAKVNGTSYEEEKWKIISEQEQEFANRERYPNSASQEAYRKKQLRNLILAHPIAWFPQHFQWRILLPDAPTFLEILGVTTSDRGTLDVLQSQGIMVAVQHYFDGKLWLLALLTPLLAITGITYILALGTLIHWIKQWKDKWRLLFVFLAFAEYYFFLVGPITAPRYQLPALPILALMAGFGLIRGYEWWKKTHPSSPVTVHQLDEGTGLDPSKENP